MDVSTERLYCDKVDYAYRRSAQTAMSEILSVLITMLAPVLSFTTEDITKYCGKKSIFENKFPKVNKHYLDSKLEEKWERILNTREKVYKKIEELRDKKEIRSSSQAKAVVYATEKDLLALKSLEKELYTIFMVSEVTLAEGEKEPEVSPSTNQKCERCWRLLPTVGKNLEHSTLCERCVKAIT